MKIILVQLVLSLAIRLPQINCNCNCQLEPHFVTIPGGWVAGNEVIIRPVQLQPQLPAGTQLGKRKVEKFCTADGGPDSCVHKRGNSTSALAEIFWRMCLQSRFHQISPFPSQNRVNWGLVGGGSPIFLLIGILIFMLPWSPYKISKL